MQKVTGFQSLLPEISSPPAHIKIQGEQPTLGTLGKNKEAPKESFSDYLKEGINEINNLQKNADNKAADLASGKSNNIHEAMLASSHAQLSFNFMVQMRNKALEAYQEVMRMPV